MTLIAILGGTGHEGSGLALRWAAAGHSVLIGSRTPEKAHATALELNARLHTNRIRGLDNLSAARAAELVVLTVPYSAHRATLTEVREAVQGKILVDVTVPLVPPKVSRVQLPPEGTASQQAQDLLGAGVRVVTAFQNIAADHLHDLGHPIECEVLVCGDDKEAKQTVIALAQQAGMTAWDAGPLANSVVPEALTSVLIGLNMRYKVKNAGLRLTGLPRE